MGKQLFHIILCGIAVMMITIPAGSAIEPTGDWCDEDLTIYGLPSKKFVNKIPTAEEVFMVLYTKNGKKISFRLSDRIEEYLLKDINFKADLPSVFFNNGFRTNPCHPATVTISNALLEHGGWNVFVFDPTQFVSGDYPSAIKNSVIVGRLQGQWLAKLYQKGVNKDFHLIGHSLGAHTAGSAGQAFREYIKIPFPRITGLDPAGPYYDITPFYKLSCADATFVDIIHTDGGMLGIIKPTGHIDFYPNGGFLQRGAPLIPPESHRRSWKYYAESIKYPCNFPAMSIYSKSICLFPRLTSVCSMITSMFSIPFSILFKPSEPKVFMGHYLQPSAGEGIYYLTTNSQPLYGQGDMECDESSEEDSELFSKIRSIFF